MYTKNKSTFANGVAVLTASALIVKLIGICYKIPLVNLLGTEGMGYFNAAYDVYALLCMISTTGLPVAVSVVMNKYKGQQQRTFRLSLYLFLIFGFIGSLTVFFCAERIADAIGAPAAAQSLRFIAPAVLFICISGALRGYYQAKRNMMPTAISQVIEAGGKLLFGLVFAYIAIHKGKSPAISAAFAILGLSVGTFLCMCYLLFCKKNETIFSEKEPISQSRILAELLKVAFPVTLGAILSGLAKMIDLSLIMRRLQDVGYSQEVSVSMYGCYSAMVMPLFNAVPALFGSLAMPLIPHLSHAIHQNDIDKQSELLSTTFLLTGLIGIPSALGMGMLSDKIIMLLYHDNAQISYAPTLLLLISIAIPASCMITSTNAVLQSYNHAWLTMITTGVGCIIKAFSLYILAGIQAVGIYAAPISTILSCFVIVCMNMILISKYAPKFTFIKHWLILLSASIACVGIAAAIKRVLINVFESTIIIILITVMVAVLVYGIILLKSKILKIKK